MDESITLRVLQQQFEKMNIICEEIRDCLDKRDIVIANLQKGRQQRVLNARRQERRTLITNFVEDYLKMKRENEIKRSCETERSKKKLWKKKCEKKKVSEKESKKGKENEKSENNGEVDNSRKNEIQKEKEERKEKEEEKVSFCVKQSDVRVAYCVQSTSVCSCEQRGLFCH